MVNQVDYDTAVIGAGIIGSSLAMALSERDAAKVAILDVDLGGEFSSSELNAGGVRATFAHRLNLELSRKSIEYFSKNASEIGFRECGYLWLVEHSKSEIYTSLQRMWQESGWPTEFWNCGKLREQRPFIDKTQDLAGAVFARRDGLVNPNLLKLHFRKNATNADFVDGFQLVSAIQQNGVWTLEGRDLQKLTSDQKLEHLKEKPELSDFQTPVRKIRARNVVNAAGAWAPQVAKALGYQSPSSPVRRQISLFESRDLDISRYGMTVDTSGVYFHPEATNVLAGFATPREKEGISFEYDGLEFFNEFIWPPLYERASGFEKLRHVTGWAGLYEVSPDETAIIGPVKNLPGLFDCHSFSGHGVMQSYQAGQCLADLIIKGRYESLDITEMNGSRFSGGQLLSESAVI